MSAAHNVDGGGQKGDMTVRFRVRDAYVPSPKELLDSLYGDRVLEGTVILRTRNGADNASVIIRVSDLDLLVVVSSQGLIDTWSMASAGDR
jgi:hypothetical protein